MKFSAPLLRGFIRLMTYPPSYYLDNDEAYTHRLIDTYGFPMLTCGSETGPLITHLPMVREGEYLYGHIAANNPMVDFIGTQQVFMAAFHGPHDYISAKLYEKPEKSVPTWNYTAVHASGTTQALNAEQSVERMAELVETYEGIDGWQMEEAAAYAGRLFPHIVYFEMRMDRVQGIRKLSQNKNAKTQARIVEDLREKGNHELADEMNLIRTS